MKSSATPEDEDTGTCRRHRRGTVSNPAFSDADFSLMYVCDAVGSQAYRWLSLPCLEADTILHHGPVYSWGFLDACYGVASYHDPAETSILLSLLGLLCKVPGELGTFMNIAWQAAPAMRPHTTDPCGVACSSTAAKCCCSGFSLLHVDGQRRQLDSSRYG